MTWPAEYVVTLDRRRYLLLIISAVVGCLLTAAVGVGAVVQGLTRQQNQTDGQPFTVWAFLVIAVLALCGAGLVAYMGLLSRPSATPWVLSDRGVQAWTREGVVAVPWSVIASGQVSDSPWQQAGTVRTRNSRRSNALPFVLTLRVRPDAVPDQDGVQATAKAWELVRKSGLPMGGPLVSVTVPELVSAVTHYSGGRVSIS